MRRAVWVDSGLEMKDADSIPALPSGWARLRMGACGICGSDLHTWHGGATRHLGTTPGHEVAGTILEVQQPGLPDAVFAVSPNVICGRCTYCTTGRPNLCRRGGYGIGFGRDGGFADYIDAPIDNLFAVKDGTSPVVASISEPLAVALRGLRLAAPDPDSIVLILGAGTIGQLCALLARDRAATVAITARHAHQRNLAANIGVTPISPDNAVSWGKENRPDIVIETVGAQADTINQAINAAARGAQLIILGSFGTTPIDMGAAMLKEVRIVGSFAYGTGRRGPEFRAAVELLPRYLGELRELQTHEFRLDQIEGAFQCAANKSSGSIKVTVVP